MAVTAALSGELRRPVVRLSEMCRKAVRTAVSFGSHGLLGLAYQASRGGTRQIQLSKRAVFPTFQAAEEIRCGLRRII